MRKHQFNILEGMETETYVVLSTAHITEDDAKLLDHLVDEIRAKRRTGLPEGLLVIDPIRSTHDDETYGWRIKHASDVGDDDLISRSMRELAEWGFSVAFRGLIQAAILSTYNGIVIDRDAETYDHIPEFEW